MSDPLRRLHPVVRLAPAKLNLSLAVLGRRPDGFHELHSVMVPLGLADRISLAPAGGSADTLHLEGFGAGPVGENLVVRAVGATRRAIGGSWPGGPAPAPTLAARLDKRIPVAAGLGGGSSDAAATVDGALEAWGAELDPEARRRVGAGLGSDVPFFLAGGPALVEGRGERVSPLAGVRGAPGILLVTPAIAVPTRDVFDAFAALRAASGERGDGSVRMSSEHLAGELRGGLAVADLLARAGVLAAANDLLPAAAAVVPTLVPFRRALFRLLARPVGLSGSGPTLWALYPSEADAAAAAEMVRAAVRDGRLTHPGERPPFVAATTILGSERSPTSTTTSDPTTAERSTGRSAP
jgi:4-diphosphocytidyl-2-C-methyl-D-erythritol kinase